MVVSSNDNAKSLRFYQVTTLYDFSTSNISTRGLLLRRYVHNFDPLPEQSVR